MSVHTQRAIGFFRIWFLPCRELPRPLTHREKQFAFRSLRPHRRATRSETRARKTRAPRLCEPTRAFRTGASTTRRAEFFRWYEACPQDLRGAAEGARAKLLHGARVPPRSYMATRTHGETRRKESAKAVVSGLRPA